MILSSEKFPEKPVGLPFRRVDQLSTDVIIRVLEKILQSNASFFSQEKLTLRIDRVSLPAGKRRTWMTGVTFEEFCRRKAGILIVVNNDNFCLGRALVLAIAFRNGDPLLKELQLGLPIMDQRLQELCEAAGVDLSNGGTYDHIELFQRFLVDYTIVVYNHRLGQSVYYEGVRDPERLVLNLILEDNHYNVITSLTSAFTTGYFCKLCRTRTNDKYRHRNCRYKCPSCHQSPPCNKMQALIKCAECNRDFHGDECFRNHSAELCKNLKKCLTCLYSVWVDHKKQHRCGFKYCNTGRVEKPIRHFCFMKKKAVVDRRRKPDSGPIFVIYDFEVRQEKVYDGRPDTFLHEVNLCVA